MEKLSDLASILVPSEIVKLGNEVNARIAEGAKIYNYTIGDFSPKEFPIPDYLLNEIIESYKQGHTNYPPAAGILPLRKSVSKFISKYAHVAYDPTEIQIASGGRPLIYALFKSIVSPGDKVVYAVPSWNTNHYVNLHAGQHCVIEASPENDFMPTADEIAPHLENATLLCLCTPSNPSGTTISKEELSKICELVIKENNKRGVGERKLYVMFDQMYFTLTFGDTVHYNPVELNPEMKEYTILIDGASKSFAATGVRVGWACGPTHVIKIMNGFLSHIGGWAPMAEQYAMANFLNNDEAIGNYFESFKSKIETRLNFIYDKMKSLQSKGYKVDVINPQAAIYLTVKFDLKGMSYNGKLIEKQSDVTTFLLNEVGVAIVPFNCFGANVESPWYRVSIGTSNIEDLTNLFVRLEEQLSLLS